MLGLGLEFKDSARVRVRVMIKGSVGLGLEFKDSGRGRVRVLVKG